MLRLMMAGRSYANVPTSDTTEKYANTNIPLRDIQHRSANMATQHVPNGSVPISQESVMTTFGPQTPPRNPTSNPTYNYPMETIPQSPDYMKDKENPYEELPNSDNYGKPEQQMEYVQYHGIDGEGPKFYSSQCPSNEPHFLRLDSTISATSTDMIVKERQSERAPRKKKNPTYEVAPFQTRNISNENQQSKEEEANRSEPSTHSCECLKTYFFIILIFMLALLALLLVVLVISGIVQTGPVPGSSDSLIGDKTTAEPGPTLQQLEHRINQLENANQALLDRFVELEQLLGVGSDNATVSMRLAQNTLKIEQLTRNVTEHDNSLKELNSELSAVTTMATQNFNDLATLEGKTMETSNRLQKVTYEVGNLTAQVTSTDAMHGSQISTLQKASNQQNTTITRLEAEFDNFEVTFSTTLMTMNQSIYEELDEISKMPGPRGYNGSQGEPGKDGVGNLSLCTYNRFTGGSSFTTSPTTTPWKGFADRIVTGVMCSTEGGTTEILEIQDASAGDYKEYRCSCNGGSGSGNRRCFMDMWDCPKIS